MQRHKGNRGLRGADVLVEGSKLGLTRKEYQMLLDAASEKSAQKAEAALRQSIPYYDRTAVNQNLLEHLRNSKLRKATQDKFDKQKLILKKIEAGAKREAELQEAVPGLSNSFI